MNIELAKPEHVVSLATSCVLVNAEIHIWSATKQDREISDEVATAKKASKRAGTFKKNLVSDNAEHKGVTSYRQIVYNFLRRDSFGWSGTQNLLPAMLLPKFMQEWRIHEAEFNRRVEAFLNIYPSLVSNMAFAGAAGDMFKRDDYPSVDQLRSKFSIDLHITDVPQGDFRVQVAHDLVDDLHKMYQRQANDHINNILQKQMGQLVEVMTSISHCCRIDTEVGEDGEVKTKRGRIHTTTVERALELCDNYSQFNLTGNAQLEEARVGLQRVLSGVNAKALSNSVSERVRVKSEVDDLLSKFGFGI